MAATGHRAELLVLRLISPFQRKAYKLPDAEKTAKRCGLFRHVHCVANKAPRPPRSPSRDCTLFTILGVMKVTVCTLLGGFNWLLDAEFSGAAFTGTDAREAWAETVMR